MIASNMVKIVTWGGIPVKLGVLSVFSHLSPSLINLSTAKFPWNKTDNTPNLTGIPPHVTILTMLEAIRKSQDGMAYDLSGNIVAELRKRGTFDDFSEEKMQSLLEGMWNNVEYAFKVSQKATGKLEYFYD